MILMTGVVDQDEVRSEVKEKDGEWRDQALRGDIRLRVGLELSWAVGVRSVLGCSYIGVGCGCIRDPVKVWF